MKRRLLYLAPLLIILVSIGAVLVKPVPVSAASTEQYMINFLPSQQAAIDSCLSNHNCDKTASSDLYNVALFVKGGVYGSTPIQLNYEPNVDHGILNSDQFAFTGNYSCGGMSISLLVTIDMGSLGQAAYPSKVFIDNIRNSAAGQDSSGIATGSDGSQVDVPLSYTQITQGLPGSPKAKLPTSCLPGRPPGKDLNTPPGGDDFSGSKYVRVNNYTTMTAAQKATWGSAGANPTYGSPTSTGPSPTTASDLVCKTGTVLGFIPNPLDWMLCGVINGLNLVVTGLDVQIDNLLALGTSSTSDNPNQIFTDSSGTCGANYTPQSGPDSGKKLPVCDAYYAGWQSFRDIALGLLVIVGLIIVISQALGMEILDAYTIRKMLPRVLLATIAITLSWQLMRLLVTLSNDLGYGVRSLMSTPFSRLGINLNLSTGGSLLAALATAAGLAIFDLFAILTFVGTAAIAVLVTFLVLILRQIVVILLIIFSPIALIAYVLPNTQRVYKFWWESFSKMLLMFPMIVALIAAGHIFAAIAANQGTDFVHQTIAVIAYFAPYFMVPMTFRFSGGIMSGLGNAVNARGDGARGYLRKRRGEAVQGRMNAWKSGEVVKNKYVPKGVRTALNTTGKGLGTGFRGHFGLGQRGKEAMGFVDQTARDEALQSASMKAIKGKNDFNRILAEANGDERQGRKALYDHLMRGGDDGRFLEQFGTREEAAAAAQTKVEQAAVAARATGGFTKARATAGFYNMAQDGTAIRDEKDLARLAAVVGGGNGNNTYTYAAEGAELSKRAGRPDLKPDTEQIGNLAFQQSDKIYNGGQARLYSGGQSEDKLVTTAKLSAYGNTQAYERFTSARGRALRNEHSFLAEVVSDSTGKYTAEEKQQAAAHIADAKNAIASGQGAVNKLGAAATALAPADIAYERYMGREAGRDNGIQFSPGQRSPAAQYSNKDEVEAAYGGDQRYGNRTLTDAQRAEEANRNQPPPEQQ